MPTRILIVDDHALIVESLRRVLNSRPDTQIVGEAADAETAMVKARESQPDIVIVDLVLPGASGLELIHRLKEICPQAKHVVLTGQTDRQHAKEALAAGASAFIRKTNGPDEILHAVNTALRGEIYLCTATTTALLHEGSMSTVHDNLGIPERELEVLHLIVKGLRNKEIAEKLGIGVKTVETHRARLMSRTGCQSPAELVRFAIRNHLDSP